MLRRLRRRAKIVRHRWEGGHPELRLWSCNRWKVRLIPIPNLSLTWRKSLRRLRGGELASVRIGVAVLALRYRSPGELRLLLALLLRRWSSAVHRRWSSAIVVGGREAVHEVYLLRLRHRREGLRSSDLSLWLSRWDLLWLRLRRVHGLGWRRRRSWRTKVGRHHSEHALLRHDGRIEVGVS